MKLKVSRYSMQIIPENETEIAYIEEVLGLKKDDDPAEARRVNCISKDGCFYISIEGKEA